MQKVAVITLFNLDSSSSVTPKKGLKTMQMPGMLSSAISTFRRCASSIQMVSFDMMEVLSMNWHLGFTAFGGPPFHFQIVRNHNLKAVVSTRD